MKSSGRNTREAVVQGSSSNSPSGAPSTQSPVQAEQDLLQGHTRQFRKAKHACTYTPTHMHAHTHTHTHIPSGTFLDPPSSVTGLLTVRIINRLGKDYSINPLQGRFSAIFLRGSLLRHGQ